MKKNALSMPPYWRGGLPLERGPYPAVIEWRPQRETTDVPEIFQGWISDIEAVLATAGLSLVTQQTGSGRIIYSAAGHRVAELQKTMDGFKGTVFARPTGGPGPGIRGQVAAEEIRRSSTWLGYGQAEYLLAPTVVRPYETARGIAPLPPLPSQSPPTVQPTGRGKLYGGAALSVAGIVGGILTALSRGKLSPAMLGVAGVGSGVAALGGGGLAVVGYRQHREAQRAAERDRAEDIIDGLGGVLPTLPQTEVVDEALSRCQFLSRTLVEPGTVVSSDSGIEPLPGDWELTVYDEERERNYTVLCTDQPRAAMHEIGSLITGDPGKGVAAVRNSVSFIGDGRLYQWSKGEKIPSSIRNQIWAMKTGGHHPVAEFVRNTSLTMNRAVPHWVMGYSGTTGGPIVRVDRAFIRQTNLWRDVFRNVVFGMARALIAVIGGYLVGGPIGSVFGASVSVGASVTGAIVSLAQEAAKIVREAVAYGRISGSWEDVGRAFLLLASTAGEDIERRYANVTRVDLTQIASQIQMLVDPGPEIGYLYGQLRGWIEESLSEGEQVMAGMVASLEGGLAQFAAAINPRETKLPFKFTGVRMIETRLTDEEFASLLTYDEETGAWVSRYAPSLEEVD